MKTLMKTEDLHLAMMLVSLFLQYPDELNHLNSDEPKRPDFEELNDPPPGTWTGELESIQMELEKINDDFIKAQFNLFLDYMGQTKPETLRRTYVDTFDFGRKTNLYLTYAQHGEQRERGPVLAKLKREYESAGYKVNPRELPDYLPLMLEFAAVAPLETGIGMLHKHKTQIKAIHDELEKENNPYTCLLKVVLKVVENYSPEQMYEGVGSHD